MENLHGCRKQIKRGGAKSWLVMAERSGLAGGTPMVWGPGPTKGPGSFTVWHHLLTLLALYFLNKNALMTLKTYIFTDGDVCSILFILYQLYNKFLTCSVQGSQQKLTVTFHD